MMRKFAFSIADDPFLLETNLYNEIPETLAYSSKLYKKVHNLTSAMMRLCLICMKASGNDQWPQTESSSSHNDIGKTAHDESKNHSIKLSPNLIEGAQCDTDLLDSLAVDPVFRDNPTEMEAQSRWSLSWWRCLFANISLINLGMQSVIYYFSIKLALLTHLYYRQEILWRSIEIKVSPNSKQVMKLSTSGAVSCFEEQHISLEGESLTKEAYLEQLYWLRSLKSHVGCLVDSIAGMGFVSNGIICCLPFIYYVYPKIMLRFSSQLRNGLEIDYLAFLFNPLGQRKRLFARIDRITLSLLQTTLDRTSNVGRRLHEIELSLPTKSWSCAFNQPVRDVKRLGLADRYFAELLVSIYESKLVRPVVLGAVWHRWIMRFTQFMLIFGMVAASSGPYLAQTIFGLFELVERAKLRLEKIECKRWNPNGTFPLWERLKITELNSKDDLQLYESYENNMSSALYLGIWVEPRHYFTVGRLIYLIELPFMCLIIGTWTSFWANLFISSSIEKIIWLQQIRAQILTCRKSFGRLRTHNDQQHHSNRRSVCLDKDNLDNLLKQLTICYINFELFRKLSPSFQKLNNFLTSQVVGLTVVALFLSYFVATNIDTRYQVPVVVSSAAVASTSNLYLLLSAYRLKLVEKFMHDLVNLLAHCSNIEVISSSYPVELWRRQVLTDLECRRNFSSRFVLYYVSWETVISLNAYVMALWLILLK